MTAANRFAAQIAAATQTTANAVNTAAIEAASAMLHVVAHDTLAVWASETTDAKLRAALAAPQLLPHERAVIERELEWRWVEAERERYEARTIMGRIDPSDLWGAH